MKRYINIHSHHPDADPGVWTLLNGYEYFEKATRTETCSIGLHPWYLKDVGQQLAELKQYASLPTVMAIGECGLDKTCETPWAIQEQAFGVQIGLANALKKPLIIHCVRAYTEVLQMLKVAIVPVIFHGFQKHPALAATITDHGYYLSFGKALIEEKENAIASMERVPADRFFLETDDSAVAIKELYRTAAGIRKTGEDALILQLQQNYKTVFNYDDGYRLALPHGTADRK